MPIAAAAAALAVTVLTEAAAPKPSAGDETACDQLWAGPLASL